MDRFLAWFLDEDTVGEGRNQRTVLTPKIYRIILAFILLWFFWSSWFIVDKDENSVVQRFGKYVRTVEPGPRFKLPWPIEKATEVSVMSIYKIEVGFRTKSVGPPAEYEDMPEESTMLTGDTNIVELDFIIQYKRSNAAKWLFKVKNPEEAINLLGQSSIRMVVGGKAFDEIATMGRFKTQEECERILQKLCDRFGIDVNITAIQLQDVHPPSEVMKAFKDVTNAKEDKERLIQEANGYRNEKIPLARGMAKELIEKSLGYQSQRINSAKGDVARFSAVLKKYLEAPTITLERLRLETAEQVVPKKDQIIDLSQGGLLKLFDIAKNKTEKKE